MLLFHSIGIAKDNVLKSQRTIFIKRYDSPYSKENEKHTSSRSTRNEYPFVSILAWFKAVFISVLGP
jgi:hypothetical protein